MILCVLHDPEVPSPERKEEAGMTVQKNIHCPQGHQTAAAANSLRRKGHEGAVEEDPVGNPPEDCGFGHPDCPCPVLH
jgi:hypothetical protein